MRRVAPASPLRPKPGVRVDECRVLSRAVRRHLEMREHEPEPAVLDRLRRAIVANLDLVKARVGLRIPRLQPHPPQHHAAEPTP